MLPRVRARGKGRRAKIQEAPAKAIPAERPAATPRAATDEQGAFSSVAVSEPIVQPAIAGMPSSDKAMRTQGRAEGFLLPSAHAAALPDVS